MPMRMFFINFRPKNYNWTLPSVSTEGASEEELRRSEQIVKSVIPKKIDDKVPLMLAIPVVRPTPPQL